MSTSKKLGSDSSFEELGSDSSIEELGSDSSVEKRSIPPVQCGHGRGQSINLIFFCHLVCFILFYFILFYFIHFIFSLFLSIFFSYFCDHILLISFFVLIYFTSFQFILSCLFPFSRLSFYLEEEEVKRQKKENILEQRRLEKERARI